MPTRTVLVSKPIHPVAMERLERGAQVLTPYEAPLDEFLALLPRVQAIILGDKPAMGPAEMDRAENLEVIGRHGIGLDNVDLAAASARGLPVTYTPDGPTESTAEHAFTLILATARRLSELDRAVRAGDFSIRNRAEAMGCELEGKHLGLLANGKGNSEELLEAVLEELKQHYEFPVVMWRNKGNASRPASADILDELARTCDVVVTAIGD